jgi:hypothetical protein
MLIVIAHALFIGRNVALAMAGQVLAPAPLALFLLLQLVLLYLLELLGGAVGVFFDSGAGGGGEGAVGEGCANLAERSAEGDGAEERHCWFWWEFGLVDEVKVLARFTSRC